MSITRPVFTTANEIKAQIDLRSKLAGHYCVAAQPKYQGGAATPPYLLIHENQHRSILCGFDHLLKLPVSRDWLLEFGRNCRHGFEQW